MTTEIQPQRLAGPHHGSARPALLAMLEARSVAVVGASARSGSFGARMLAEVAKSTARPAIYPVNPRYTDIDGHRCYPSLADLPGPADLVLLGVPDASLEQQMELAAELGCRSAVIFGNAHEDHSPTWPDPAWPNPAGARPTPQSPAGPPLPAGLPAPTPQSPAGAPVPAGLTPAPAQPDANPTALGAAGATAHPPLRQRLAAIALSAGMELCGAGCMGFANAGYGLRAMGYVEPDPLPAGPVALVTHSGSVFSALLRTRRAFGFTLAVSSGQELVTATPSYLSYALGQPETRVLALVLEAMRQPGKFREVLAIAAERDLPVILLTAGNSASGRTMVAAHSGALAGSDGGWEALTRAYGIHRMTDLAEMSDTLELFSLRTRRRPRAKPAPRPAEQPDHSPDPPHRRAQQPNHSPDPPHRRAEFGVDGPSTPIEQSGWAIHTKKTGAQSDQEDREDGSAEGRGITPVTDVAHVADVAAVTGVTRGIATVHDSGLERAHAADVAEELGVPFAAISDATRAKLTELLDPGLLPTNPLDVWGTGASTRELFAGSLAALAQDESVDAVALAVDLVTELDGDDAYPLAMLDVADRTDKPLAVISNLPSAIDPDVAALLRRSGIPVLEGMRTGMLALRHLLDHLNRPQSVRLALGPRSGLAPRPPSGSPADQARLARAAKLLAEGRETGTAHLALLREYGIAAARAERVASADDALAAAAQIGYPVVLKTDEPGIAHKSDAHGVILGIADETELVTAYADLAVRLGPAAVVCETVPTGTELALGIVRDPDLGPLIVIGAGGILVELIADRAVALPPLTDIQAARLLSGLKVSKLLAGARGAPPADLGAITRAITGLADLAGDLGDDIEALDINPLICGPNGAIAVDALVIPR